MIATTVSKWLGWSIQSLNTNVGVGDMSAIGTAQAVTVLSPRGDRYVAQAVTVLSPRGDRYAVCVCVSVV